MLRRPDIPVLLVLSVLVCAATVHANPRVEPAPGQAAASPFDLRVVQLPGPLDRADLEQHLAYLSALDFNAVWVQAHQIAANPLGDPPEFNPAAQILAKACAERGMRVIVSVAPAVLVTERHAFSDDVVIEGLRRFARHLRRELRVSDLVLSFEDAPPKLTEIRDVLAYGRNAAAAHVDLAARLRSGLGRRTRLWFQPAGLFTGPLPSSVGLIWQGSGAPARRVEAAEFDRLRVATGKRPTLLRDRYPANQAGPRMPLSHNLGPLRDRDAGLASRLTGHVSVAMEDWGASRLTLATAAEWLRDPARYQAKPAWEKAMKALAGDNVEALEALRTQALEWGGPIGGLNHHTAWTDNPAEAGGVLRDPALAARWKWTLTRYPDRMAAISGLADEPFRIELLEVMARRLAIARAIPTTREILARQSAGRSDLAGLIAELNRLRGGTTPRSARQALERFLAVAGLLAMLDRAEDSPARQD